MKKTTSRVMALLYSITLLVVFFITSTVYNFVHFHGIFKKNSKSSLFYLGVLYGVNYLRKIDNELL